MGAQRGQQKLTPDGAIQRAEDAPRAAWQGSRLVSEQLRATRREVEGVTPRIVLPLPDPLVGGGNRKLEALLAVAATPAVICSAMARARFCFASQRWRQQDSDEKC
jgi:hypothetical protein